MEWDAFAGYLECWTNTFKSEINPVDIDSVVNILLLEHDNYCIG